MIPRSMIVVMTLVFCSGGYAQENVTPLPRAHAHNDYLHQRPLLDALDQGFCSVEADIYLVDGALLVAHELKNTKPERTLEALYLRPLHDRVVANGGRVYPKGPTVQLLVDIKADGEKTYEVLRPLLAKYEDMLTVFDKGKVESKAVTIVLSGAAPRDVLKAETRRLAAIDGRFAELDTKIDPALTPLISESWGSTFRWNELGEMPADVRKKLKDTVDKIHSQGATVRFWAIPSREAFWQVLYDCGVDYLNADDLPRLRKFLLAQPSSTK